MLTEPDDHAPAEVVASAGIAVGASPGSRADDVAPAATRASNWPAWLIPAGYLVAAIIVTWRLWADPASRTVAGNPDDADLFAWYMRYAATAIAHGQLPALVTSALNAPSGINLMWNSSLLLPSILLAPVTLLFGAQVSLTVLTTLGFAGSAAVMFWVLRRWQISDSAAALAGALYGFSPALLQSALGHYDLQFAVLPPMIVDAMLRIAIGPPPGAAGGGSQLPGSQLPGSRLPGSRLPGSRLPGSRPPDSQLAGTRQQVKTGITLGLLITAQLFVSEELALTTVLTGALLVVILGTGFGPLALDRLVPTLTGAAVAVFVALVTAGWALWVQFFGPLAQSGTPFLHDFYENDLSGFITPSGFLLFHTSASAATAAAYRGQAPEYLAYLGWPLVIVLAVAAAAFWLKPVIRAFAATVVLLALLSLGGYPLLSGTGHIGVDLPWHWLENLPLAGSVLPDRFSILLDGVAAVLLALALDQARQRLREPGRRPSQQHRRLPEAAIATPGRQRCGQAGVDSRGQDGDADRSLRGSGEGMAGAGRSFGGAGRSSGGAGRSSGGAGRSSGGAGRSLRGAGRSLRGAAGEVPMRTRARTAVVTGIAALACLPIVPLPLPSATPAPLPAGWTAAFAALHLPDGARVLVVPVPEVHLTEAMRWQADSGQQYSLIGGYFIGPAWNGQAYIDGNGLAPTSVYLNELWAASLRPGSALANAAAGAGLAAPVEALATTQLHADLTAWQPQAVIAVTPPDSALARYLTSLFGQPTISTGGVIAWRAH